MRIKPRFFLIVAAIMVIMSGCTGKEAVKTDMDGLILYNNFLNSLDSGVIQKTYIGFDELYDIVGCTVENIRFSKNDKDERILTYNERNPFIFWMWGQTNYYNGQNYYYKYNGDWFVDRYNRFQNQIEESFMGVPENIINDNEIIQNEVYQNDDNSYTMIIRSSDYAQAVFYQITGKMNKDFVFEEIEVKTTRTVTIEDEVDGEAVETKKNKDTYYYIKYKSINNDVHIQAPADLDTSTLFYVSK